MSSCIEQRRIEEIDLVVVPLAAAGGAKFKGYAPGRRRAKLRERENERLASLPPEVAAAAKEDRLLAAFASAGIKVKG